MVGRSGYRRVTSAAFLTLLAVGNLPGAEADERAPAAILSLRQMNERRLPDSTAAHAGERALIRGTVNARVFRFRGYSILTIEDATAGAALQMFGDDRQRLEAYRPGDAIEADGVVSMVDGMVVLVPAPHHFGGTAVAASGYRDGLDTGGRLSGPVGARFRPDSPQRLHCLRRLPGIGAARGHAEHFHAQRPGRIRAAVSVRFGWASRSKSPASVSSTACILRSPAGIR